LVVALCALCVGMVIATSKGPEEPLICAAIAVPFGVIIGWLIGPLEEEYRLRKLRKPRRGEVPSVKPFCGGNPEWSCSCKRCEDWRQNNPLNAICHRMAFHCGLHGSVDRDYTLVREQLTNVDVADFDDLWSLSGHDLREEMRRRMREKAIKALDDREEVHLIPDVSFLCQDCGVEFGVDVVCQRSPEGLRRCIECAVKGEGVPS